MDDARLNLTRRFQTADEARVEAETNLSAGSVWVPFDPGTERPALLRAVIVSLVLPDGGALDGLFGRVSCVASAGAAVALDDLPSALVLTRLLGGEMRPAISISTNGELAPEEAPPLPSGIPDGWEPVPPLRTEDPARMAPPEPEAPPPLEVPPPADGVAVSFDGPAPERPIALERATDSVESVDFPVPRESAPVPAVSAEAGMWDDAQGLDPALKDPPAEGEPEGPARPCFSVRFADSQQLEQAWRGELGAGRVMVSADDPPPLDTPVEVTLLLPEIGALMLEGTVVHRAGGSAGIRLELDATSRALIESALPSEDPTPAPPSAAEPPEAAPPAPAPPAAPTLELRKDASGKAIVVVAFESLADFRREYETNIRRGGVMVPTAERPPVRSVVEVVFSLLGGKREVKLQGEVVLHGPAGIGVQLGEIPQTTRVEIDSLLAAAGTPAPPPAVAVTPAAPRPAVEPRPALAPAGPPLVDGALPPPSPRAPPVAPSGIRFEGELVEVMREAEVEGEAGVGDAIGPKASWLKVLAYLQATRSTGLLQAVRKAETKSYVVFQGRILDAKGEPPRDDESMLRVIRKHGLAKPGVVRILEKALDRVPDEIEALESSNIWTANDIDRARRWQVLERAAEVFAWEKGRFAFDPNGDRAWSRPTPGVPFGQVILYGVRTYIRASGDDLARILRAGLDRSVRVVQGTGFEPARVGMTDKELKFWAEIDGTRTLRQLLATSPIAVSQTHRLVFALCRLGVLSLERGGSAPTTRPKETERAEALRARAADMKTRDVFGKLSLSWMCAAPHVQGAWDAVRRELEPDQKAGGAVAQAANEVLVVAEEAYRQLIDERTRRLQRLKLIEDPARIEAAAEMLAERAEVLRMQGDVPGAESAVQMALDMAPRNPAFVELLARVRAR